jgi:hypothetical protein
MNEGVRNVTGQENTFDTQVYPSWVKMWKGDAPVFFSFVNVRLVKKPKATVPETQETLVISAVLFVRDFRIDTGKGWQIRVSRVLWPESNWRGGIMPAISCNGTEAVVPLSNNTMYDCSSGHTERGRVYPWLWQRGAWTLTDQCAQL